MGIYEDLGVKTLINGYATLTRLGGSLMPPAVLEAMAEAARSFVDLDELQEKVGRRIAGWTRNEAAYVSAGAAAGLSLATAACITGTDPNLRSRLPYSDGLKNEIIIHRKGRVAYIFAVRQAGGKIVEIGNAEGASEDELENAIGDNTAGVLYFANPNHDPGQIPLKRGIEIAHGHGIPVIVDAAAQIPPIENLWRFTEMGANMVLFSGGKGLRGPQASGLMLGSEELIKAAACHASPRPFIGRPMKAGKEEIIGLMTAVRLALDEDQDALLQRYEDQVEAVIAVFSGTPHVQVNRAFPSEAGQPMPRAELILDEEVLGLKRDTLLNRLLDGDPPISLAPSGEAGVYINPQTLEKGEIDIIIRRIARILETAGRD
jgi:L-seryl-tRNA(Ser) seleniumtransferase